MCTSASLLSSSMFRLCLDRLDLGYLLLQSQVADGRLVGADGGDALVLGKFSSRDPVLEELVDLFERPPCHFGQEEVEEDYALRISMSAEFTNGLFATYAR